MESDLEPHDRGPTLSAEAFDAIPASIAIIDQGGRIVLVNGAWRAFAVGNGLQDPTYGVGSNYLAACRVDKEGVGGEHPAVAGIRAVLEGTLGVFEFEYPCHSPEVRRFFLLRCALIPGSKPAQAVIAHVDITARVLAEEALALSREHSRRQQEQLAHMARLSTMGQMASGLAHELSQPLAAIRNYAAACQSLMERPDPPKDTVREGFNQLLDESLRATEIVRRMRNFARRQPPRRSAVDVNAAVISAETYCGVGTRITGIRVERHLATDLPAALVDAVLLEQVLVNLIGNATDSLAESALQPRTIVISTRKTESQTVEVAVRDNGPGVPLELLPRLFEPFFTTKKDGLGMGLNLSRTIIEDNGGRLTASYAPGGGMCFIVTLPVCTFGVE